jgi:hypothetical protein
MGSHSSNSITIIPKNSHNPQPYTLTISISHPSSSYFLIHIGWGFVPRMLRYCLSVRIFVVFRYADYASFWVNNFEAIISHTVQSLFSTAGYRTRQRRFREKCWRRGRLPLRVFGRRTSGLVSNHQVSCTCSASNTLYCGQIL